MVRVDIANKIQLSCEPNDCAFVGSSLKVADNHFDCCCVAPLWFFVITGHLAYGKGDVHSSVCGQVEKHSDNAGVFPRMMIKRFAIFIISKSSL